MGRKLIIFLIGRLTFILSLLFLLPIGVAILYQEDFRVIISYLLVSLVMMCIGYWLSKKKPTEIKMKILDGIIVVALIWIVNSFVGALPLVLTGEMPNIFDAFFEMSSGFTTTGSSVLSDLSQLSHASLFWRSFSHFVGGMGILVFTLAVLPTDSNYVHLMRAEVPGPEFGKLVSKISESAKILYVLYSIMTGILILLLIWAQVPLFDAMLLAFGTAGTGGFSVNNGGLSIYANVETVEWLIAVGMLLFGVNFNVYYYFTKGFFKEVILKDEELRYYLVVVLMATGLILINLHSYPGGQEVQGREVFFTVSSIMTTTGYTVKDFGHWPLFSQAILLLLMFIGGMAGSTAGGIKLSRIIIYVKTGMAELRRAIQPQRKIAPTFSGKPISKERSSNVHNYLAIYIFTFILIFLSMSLEVDDFETAFSAVAATFNNIGPGLGQVGPINNFGHLSNWNKFVLSLGMIAGRLEIIPIVILFSPRTSRYLVKGY